MISHLQYGRQRTLRLDLPQDALVANCDAPRGHALIDVTEATRSALESPSGFPPLAQAAIAGDHVAIAVGPDVPRAETIVAAVIAVLVEAGVAPQDITVLTLHSPERDADFNELLAKVPDEVKAAIRLEKHDPAERDKLCFLATSHEGKPVYLNRALCDADVVVPIGCVRAANSLGHHGVSTALYPTFSDSTTLQRFRSPAVIDSDVQRNRFRKEADEVRWLLGVIFTVQVVPGGEGEVLHVLAGDPEVVGRVGTELFSAAWAYEVPRRADLVVASIGESAGEQTWENVGRALSAAACAVADNGSIAICTDLAGQPGPGLQHLAGADDVHAALRQIVKQRPSDALAAAQVAHALERNKVYLLSRLDEDVVEDLGIAPVSSADQIARLSARHASCILLANAQYATIQAHADE